MDNGKSIEIASWWGRVLAELINWLQQEGYTQSSIELVQLISSIGLDVKVIKGYDVWYTQGFEYMVEVIYEQIKPYLIDE